MVTLKNNMDNTTITFVDLYSIKLKSNKSYCIEVSVVHNAVVYKTCGAASEYAQLVEAGIKKERVCLREVQPCAWCGSKRGQISIR